MRELNGLNRDEIRYYLQLLDNRRLAMQFLIRTLQLEGEMLDEIISQNEYIAEGAD